MAESEFKGKVKRKTETETQKLVKLFFTDSIDGLGKILLTDIIAPAFKATAFDIAMRSVAAILGISDPKSLNINIGSSASSYANAYNRGRSNTSSTNAASSHVYSYDKLIFSTKDVAKAFVTKCKNYIYSSRNAVLTISKMYELLGDDMSTHHNYTDDEYGWRSLPHNEESYIVWTRDGWEIKFPEPEHLVIVI